MKTKKIFLLSIFLFLFLVFSVIAAPVSLSGVNNSLNVLATVTVAGKTETITQAEVDSKKAEYSSAGVENTNEEILDILINDKVFMMSAERDNVSVTDKEVEDRIKLVRNQLEIQAGKAITETEFNSYIQQNLPSGYSLDDYKKDMKNQLLVDKYVRTTKSADLDKVPVVSDSEITAFYRRNATQFVNPEYVRVSHVYMKKGANDSDNNRIKEKLRSILNDIKNGNITFERAVQQYTEDNDSKAKGGDIGIITGSYSSILGDSFIDDVFALDVGDISNDIIESKTGYHIIKATAHEYQKFLKIDDYVAPENPTTVREYIRAGLQQQKQQEDYANVINAFIEDLKKDARIVYTNS